MYELINTRTNALIETYQSEAGATYHAAELARLNPGKRFQVVACVGGRRVKKSSFYTKVR